MDTYQLIKKLTETPGPSGLEETITPLVRELWQPYADEIEVDRMGNLIALKRGKGDEPRRRVLIAAHMDELGLMVKQIEGHDGYGFLRLTPVGGVDRRHLYGQLVTVHASKGEGRRLAGVIGAPPASWLPDDRRSEAYRFEDLLVDVGLPIEELEALVSVGDFISFRQPLRKLLNHRIAGKALDNRVSVAAVAICLEQLSGRDHQWDLLAVATAQEETRLLGAFTAGYAHQPDVAIAVDVTHAKGPGVGSGDGPAFELGDGPPLGLGVNVHPGVFEALKEAADALELKVHTDPHGRASGTDAFALQVARAGIPTGLVEIPLRYMHTMVETVATRDVERAGRLLAEFVARLEADFLEKLADEMMA